MTASTQSLSLPISDWAHNLSSSPTFAVEAKAKALAAAGHDVCRFGVGEPDSDTPDFIKEAAITALRQGHTKYLPTAGLPALLEAVAERYTHECGVRVRPSQVIVSPSAKFSCYLALLSVCNPGDEVLIQAPYWVSYPEMVKLTGAKPVLLHTGIQDGFKLSPAAVQAALGPRTKVLILNSPCNPTGVVYTPEELQTLAEICVRHGCYILFDEIYEHLVYDQARHVTLASLSQKVADHTLTVSGFSKSFSMTGWRLGTLVAPPAVAQAAEKLQSHICSNATSFAQYGALEALRNKPAAQAFLLRMRETFDRRRKLLFDGLQGTPGLRTLLPEGAFYLFPCIEGLKVDSLTFASRLLEEEKVALVPGAAFGSPDGLRLSYATSETVITSGIQRIRRFCERLAQGDLAL